jgi:hypothetical protein
MKVTKKLVEVATLEGFLLDWAVAKCDGKSNDCEIYAGNVLYGSVTSGLTHYSPSTSWLWGGPIIEREGLYLRAVRREGHPLDGLWLAAPSSDNTGTIVQWVKRKEWKGHYSTGPTVLIAAMRCYVASALGDEIELPEGLI